MPSCCQHETTDAASRTSPRVGVVDTFDIFPRLVAPDIKQRSFTGSETIDVLLDRPTNAITLNAAEIQFVKVTATAAGKTLTATVSADPDKEQVTFSFPQALPGGSVTLAIEYTGVLNGELRGFYLSKTAKRDYAVTQFEPTDAHRTIPLKTPRP